MNIHRGFLLYICGALIVASMMPVPAADLDHPTVKYDHGFYPVATVKQSPMQEDDLCALITGTVCHGQLPGVKFSKDVAFYSVLVAWWHLAKFS